MRTSLPAAGSIVKKSRLLSRRLSAGIVHDESTSKHSAVRRRRDHDRLSSRLAVVRMGRAGVSWCLAGCGHVIPIAGTFHGEGSANVTADATVRGAFEVKMPSSVDPGNMTGTVVRAGDSGSPCSRIALVDVDGLLLNQNFGSLVSVGDNPLSALRDKLDAAARDPAGRGGRAPDQQPRRERHYLRHHGRRAAPVSCRDT